MFSIAEFLTIPHTSNSMVNGYKTYAAGIASIIIGVVGIICHFAFPDSVYVMDVQAGVEMILVGLVALGMRHAIETTKVELKETEEVVVQEVQVSAEEVKEVVKGAK